MLECFLNLPDVDHEHPFMLEYNHIQEHQDQDADLVAQLNISPNLERRALSDDLNII